jgi:putative membrane protein
MVSPGRPGRPTCSENRMSIRSNRGIALLGAFALVAACSKGDTKADSAAVADSIAKASAAATPAPAPAAPALNDANIFALLDEANMTDSAGGAMAATKATNSDVRAFGKEMARDHHALRKGGADLAKKLNITPAPPAGDTLPAAAQKGADAMTQMAKGADWDKAYIDHEVAVHQSVLALLQTAQGAAQDASLKAMITKAQPLIQAHLDNAQKIQTKLNAAKP